MKLKDLLIQNRSVIIENWFQSILNTYAPYSLKFLSRKEDQFKNPIGFTISKGIEVLYDEILGVAHPEKLVSSLNDIVKIRAVQDFFPSQALSFIFLLKDTLRDNLKNEIIKYSLYESMAETESKIDELALRAFDYYMAAKEKIFQIKVNEIKSNVFNINRFDKKKLKEPDMVDMSE